MNGTFQADTFAAKTFQADTWHGGASVPVTIFVVAVGGVVVSGTAVVSQGHLLSDVIWRVRRQEGGTTQTSGGSAGPTPTAAPANLNPQRIRKQGPGNDQSGGSAGPTPTPPLPDTNPWRSRKQGS